MKRLSKNCGNRGRRLCWQKAFHCNKPSHIRVLSRPDLTTRNFDNHPKMQWYGKSTDVCKSWYGETKKDITKIGPLANTVMIDDNCGYAMEDHIRNYLEVNRYSFYHISSEYAKGEQHLLYCLNSDDRDQYLTFHKLLHVVGVLETAMLHKDGIINGLSEIYFIDEKSNHRPVATNAAFYTLGHKILSKYVSQESYSKLEILENLILQ